MRRRTPWRVLVVVELVVDVCVVVVLLFEFCAKIRLPKLNAKTSIMTVAILLITSSTLLFCLIQILMTGEVKPQYEPARYAHEPGLLFAFTCWTRAMFVPNPRMLIFRNSGSIFGCGGDESVAGMYSEQSCHTSERYYRPVAKYQK